MPCPSFGRCPTRTLSSRLQRSISAPSSIIRIDQRGAVILSRPKEGEGSQLQHNPTTVTTMLKLTVSSTIRIDQRSAVILSRPKEGEGSQLQHNPTTVTTMPKLTVNTTI